MMNGGIMTINKHTIISLVIGIGLGSIIVLIYLMYINPRPPVFPDLDVSSSQSNALQKIRTTQMSKLNEQFNKIRQLHDQLDEILLSDSPNNQTINIITEEIAYTHADMARIHIQGLLKIREILSEKQFSTMIRHRKSLDKHPHHPKMKGGSFGGGPPMVP